VRAGHTSRGGTRALAERGWASGCGLWRTRSSYLDYGLSDVGEGDDGDREAVGTLLLDRE
jgi:hypothetical protein